MELDMIKLLFGFIIAFDVLIYIDIWKMKRKNNIKIELADLNKYKNEHTMGYHLYVEYRDNTDSKTEDKNDAN
jgi:hypothetical protein